jgi:hypothetical protein
MYCILIISRSVVRMRSVSDKFVDKIETHILCSVTIFEIRALYEIMWKNTVQPGRPQMKIWRMCISCWIPKPTNSHLQNVILIGFPLLQCFHENASKLGYMYCTLLLLVSGWICCNTLLRWGTLQRTILQRTFF